MKKGFLRMLWVLIQLERGDTPSINASAEALGVSPRMARRYLQTGEELLVDLRGATIDSLSPTRITRLIGETSNG